MQHDAPQTDLGICHKTEASRDFVFGDFADAGALMSYGPSRLEMFKRAAYFVDRILSGVRPSDLPVEQPAKWS